MSLSPWVSTPSLLCLHCLPSLLTLMSPFNSDSSNPVFSTGLLKCHAAFSGGWGLASLVLLTAQTWPPCPAYTVFVPALLTSFGVLVTAPGGLFRLLSDLICTLICLTCFYMTPVMPHLHLTKSTDWGHSERVIAEMSCPISASPDPEVPRLKSTWVFLGWT